MNRPKESSIEYLDVRSPRDIKFDLADEGSQK